MKEPTDSQGSIEEERLWKYGAASHRLPWVYQGKPPSGAENPGTFTDGFLEIRNMFNRMRRDDKVEAPIGELQVLRIHDL
jgi:hypothetical protein